MDGISRVLQRITAIENRFTPRVTNGAFAHTLNRIEQQSIVSPTKVTDRNENVKMINIAAQKYGVDAKLALAVAKTESNFSSEAISPAGAIGVMQLMPDTARSLGVRNISDPRENIDGGVHYLKQMLTIFDGDITKAVAAYNAGPAAVQRYNGIPPYAETQDYVRKVLNSYRE